MIRRIKVTANEYAHDNYSEYFKNAHKFEVVCECEKQESDTESVLSLNGSREKIMNFVIYLMMKDLKIKHLSNPCR